MVDRSIVQQSFGRAPPRPSWWRLGATATLRVAKERGWSADADNGGAPWIGRQWNGRSNIKLGSEAVPAQTVAGIIEHLRHGIASLNVQVARLPDSRSVRHCSFSGPWLSTIVIDVDFGEFILPVSITENLLVKHPRITAAEVGSGMMDIIMTADAVRSQVGALDLELRNAVVEQSILAGVTPLWFRMFPWHFNVRYEAPLSDTRELMVLMLDEDLRPIISDLRLCRSAPDITYYLRFHGEMQRRRSAMRSKLDAAGSAAFVTEVARGLIDVRGMDPVDVLDRLRTSRLAQDRDGILLCTETTRERLTLVEGLIDAAIDFEGGNYRSGKLTLQGDFPETFAIAAKGRPLTAFVDHPAFRAARVKIKYARALRGRLRLYHTVRSSPVEEVALARAERVPATSASDSD